jgi:UDP-N-acetylmuramoyl-tripeptide--D-alanyl-D-alanine ligase
MHERVGERAAQLGVDVLLVGGEFAKDTVLGARHAGLPAERIVLYGSNADAVAWLRHHARDHDAVLLKGSRKYAMEEILAGMLERAVVSVEGESA